MKFKKFDFIASVYCKFEVSGPRQLYYTKSNLYKPSVNVFSHRPYQERIRNFNYGKFSGPRLDTLILAKNRFIQLSDTMLDELYLLLSTILEKIIGERNENKNTVKKV